MALLEVQATEEAKQAQDGLIEALLSLGRPSVMVRREIGKEVRIGIATNFLAQRAGDGPKWTELRPYTIRERLRLGYGASPMLYRTGKLFRSYTEEFDPDHSQRFRSTRTGWEMEFGSDDYRAGWHEGGTRRMPARPVLFLGHRAQDAISREFNRLFNLILEQAGY